MRPDDPGASADEIEPTNAPALSATPIQHMSSPVISRIFLGLAAFFFTLAVLYALLSDGEWAGVVLLALSGALSSISGLFIAFVGRRGLVEELGEEDYGPDSGLFLPTSSLRPFWMGAGLTLVAGGFPFGILIMAPGVALFLYGLVGFVQEGRTRRH